MALKKETWRLIINIISAIISVLSASVATTSCITHNL